MTVESGGTSGRAVEPTAEQPRYVGSTEVLPAQSGESQIVYVQEPRRRGRKLLWFVGVVGLIVALFFGLRSFDLLPDFKNPFATQTTDRTGPVLLQSVKDLSRYVAAEGDFQVLVDLQENNSIIPNFIFNDHTIFLGVGSVDAYVDFSKLTEGNIIVSPDGKSVEFKLPMPTLEKPSLDTKNSYPLVEEKGVFNRVGDFFGGDLEKQNQLYQLAENKIADAATKSGLQARAQKNTELMLRSLLTQLGFERVTITWLPAAAP